MLREVINKHIKPRIVPFQLTTTASGVTLNEGYGDFTATRSGTGAGVLTARQGFYRNGLYFANQSVGTGGYAPYNSATPDNDAFPYSILNAAGSGVEGSCEGFVFGWDSPDLSLTKVQRVAATIERPRIIWGKITGATGAVAIGLSDFSCTRTGTGTYTITFKRAFGQVPVVMTQARNASSTSSTRLSNKTALSVTVTTGDNSSVGDRDFYILAIGSDSTSDSARGRMPLQNSQRKPRIIAGQVLNTGGVPSLAIGGATGGADFTNLVDVGAGRFTVKVAEPFVREPAIFLTTTTQRAWIISFTNNVLDFVTQDASGGSTDVNGVTNIFIIGSDDASEY